MTINTLLTCRFSAAGALPQTPTGALLLQQPIQGLLSLDPFCHPPDSEFLKMSLYDVRVYT